MFHDPHLLEVYLSVVAAPAAASRTQATKEGIDKPRALSNHAQKPTRTVQVASLPALLVTIPSASLNNLVRPLQQRLGDREPERLRGLQIDYQFEPRRLLNRKIRRLGALQDPVDEGGGARLKTGRKCVIGHQATGIDHGSVRVPPRQFVLGREVDHSLALSNEYALGRRKDSFGALPGSSVERGGKVIGGTNVADQQFHFKGVGRTLQFLYLGRRNRVYEIREHEHSRDSGHSLLQQLETLGSKPGTHGRRPGDIPPRSGEARDEPGRHRVAETEHDDRDRASCLLRGLSGRGGGHDDDVRLESHAVGGEGGKPLAPALRGEVVDGDGLLIHIAQIAQALEERVKPARLRRTWIERQEAEPRDPPRRLRLSGERHGDHGEDEDDA